MTGVAVKIQNISKVIKGKKIIDSLSFEVNTGEVFGFLGPNGAGKTTTIRMMVGLIGMTSGDIIICEHSIKNHFEKAISHVGAIVENPELYKFMSGYQNLVHFARLSNEVSKEKIDEVVNLVGLTDRIHDKVKTYSLGMRQRLGLAQSLLHDPTVLILDEPTNGLDPAGIREMRDYLRILAKERNMAIIVSSHLLAEMEMMCDRIGIIQDGQLIDVQLVNEFIQGTEKTYLLDVKPMDEAIHMVKSLFPTHFFIKKEHSLSVQLLKDDIPKLIKQLVQHDIEIYEIKEVSKTLEDRFLEVTRQKGELPHA